MFTRADLHIHSTASDGALSPKEIILLSKSRGIDTIAIADHNSVSGIDEASKEGKLYDISVIPAVELSTRYKTESIHLLGYFRDRRFEQNTFNEILKLIKNHNINEVRRIFGGFRRKQILDNFLSTYEGMHLLRTFGAAVVLAHPIRISKENLPELLSLPFDGIEAKYCFSTTFQTNYFINVALKKFYFYTAGSDFHTDKIIDNKHCLIGNPYLNYFEIQRFLINSGVLVLGGYNHN